MIRVTASMPSPCRPLVARQPSDSLGPIPIGGRAMVPFALAALLALAVAESGPAGAPVAVAAAAVGTVVVIALGIGFAGRPRGGWLGAVPSLLYVGVVALLRHGSGGAASGYSALLLLPVVAMALHGSRAHLAAVILASGLALAVPILAIGAPMYPDADWRRLAIVLVVASLTGVAIQSLVDRARRLTAEAAAAQASAAAEARRLATIVDVASDPILALDAELRIVSWNPAATALLGHAPEAALGRDATDLLLRPDDAAWARAAFAAILEHRAQERHRFELDAVTATGQTIPVEVAVAIDPGATELAVHVVVREIAARRAAAALAADHLADLNELVRVAGTLGELTDPAAARSLMCEAACTLAGADHAFLFEPDPDTGLLVPTAEAGSVRVPHVVLQPATSRAGRVLATGEPCFVPNLSADPAVDHAAAELMGVRSAHWQPVLRDGEAIGVLVTYWVTARDALPDRTGRLLALLADQARAAIARAEHLGRIAEEATTDPLTGAGNRRGLRAALERARDRALATGRSFAIILLDLDHFKAFNDGHGHLAGDDLLREVARAWAALLRPEDTLTRYGGEEFLVVLPDCTVDDAVVAADRLRAAVPRGQTASAGIAVWDGGEPLAALTARADAALYRAKAHGRNRTELGADR